MSYRQSFGTETYNFKTLAEVLAKASPLRSGDQLAGIAATCDEERVAARFCLANIPLKHFLANPLVPYERDEVTRLICDSFDEAAFQPVQSQTLGEFRDWLVGDTATPKALVALRPALTPEMVAGVSKIMRNQDLMVVSKKCRLITKFRNTIGLEGCLSVRLQPNHPTDDPHAIMAATLDGLLYGMGDAVIGINPVTDSPAQMISLLTLLDDLRCAFDIPTQTCVLAHVTTALEVMNKGAPVDLVFQSIAGTEAANESFGVNLAILKEAQDAALALKRGTIGTNVMYFETGQGAALSADAHEGLDQQTVEARAYAVARAFDPLLVNSVVGFIGPEYLYDGKQISRAGLEDLFCGKLLGLPMGVDVCYTNHAEADQDDMDTLLTVLAASGCTYVMGVPGADDIMLNYQSTSFHDALAVRSLLGLKPAPEFETWLQNMEIMRETGKIRPNINAGSQTQKLLEVWSA